MGTESAKNKKAALARGLVVKTPGGRFGWLARRFFPITATRIYLKWIRVTRERATHAYIHKFISAEPSPWFDHVEIETLNRCNGDCAFCPASRGHDSRPFKKMPEKLFARIIGQLSATDYNGYLGLFSNNEPLLDDRLEGFAATARASLPDAYLALSTNGSLLNIDRLRRLLPLFDRIVINNYDTHPVMHENVRCIRDFCHGYEGARLLEGRTLEICLRCSQDILTTRAGSAPNRASSALPLTQPCALPFSQLIVRPDGKVSLCCNDALGRMTLGDLASGDIKDVWFGQASRGIRRTMLESGRAGIPLCRECDFVKHDL